MSSTGITLTFSKTLEANQSIDPANIIILDGSGTRLNVTAIEIQGNKLMLTTDMQVAERLYIVARFAEAKDTTGSLAITLKQIDFRGFLNKGQNGSDRLPPENPTNLRLVPKSNGKGLYDVFSFWKPSPDSAGDLSGYEVSVTNNGRIYTLDASLPDNARETKHENLKPGSTFGVRVQSKDASGNLSSGISQVIRLPQSGIGLFGITAVSIGLAGRSLRKRKNKA